MNSLVGVFRQGEIDGKPFHIINFLYQTDNPSSSSSGKTAIDSGGDDFPPPSQPLFICQSFRKSDQWRNQRYNDPNRKDFVPVEVYPLFYNKRNGDEQFKYKIGSEIYDNPCKLPLVPLFWCNNKETYSHEFSCCLCGSSKLGTDYYLCVDTCGKKFHKECIEIPLEIKQHPSYPFLSLKLYHPPGECLGFHCCGWETFKISEMVYYSPTEKLLFHPLCAMKPIPIVIDNQKRHPHPLTFFPKQYFIPCDVCGLIRKGIPTYVCVQCVFVAHQDCIYHPYVIKISRHHHRVSFTYSLPSGEFSCGVCRRKVDNNYGAYSCNKCDDYFVHTKCALRLDVWDQKELEGVPESEEVVEPPFKMISDGIILHFSHGHRLELEMSRVYDEYKVCQACVLPIYEGNYYRCMDQCDFILHETCANAPCKKQHALHAQPLTLKVIIKENTILFGSNLCYACRHLSCGSFAYKGPYDVQLDLRCASVSEPFKYEVHEHPLFLALTPEEEEVAICQICQEEENDARKLNCIECNYIICFKCAIRPYKAGYKHDKHLLTFRKKEEASSDDHSGWCDICEGKIVFSKRGGYYSCHDDYCSTTVHVKCLLGGEGMYMKPGQILTFYRGDEEVHILDNKTMSRPFCHRCNHRCPNKTVFKRGSMKFCSIECLFGWA